MMLSDLMGRYGECRGRCGGGTIRHFREGGEEECLRQRMSVSNVFYSKFGRVAKELNFKSRSFGHGE